MTDYRLISNGVCQLMTLLPTRLCSVGKSLNPVKRLPAQKGSLPEREDMGISPTFENGITKK
jgi:hypothetical protein